MDDDQQFCLRWNNHQSTLVAVFDTLLENEKLVDCTLAAEGKFLNAHKVVLSACSPYFESLLSRHYDKHPILILKDVKFQELKAMMDYMYRGEVNISQDQLGALLKAAESLQIKGLSDNKKDDGPTKRPAPAPAPPKSPQPQTQLPKVQGLTIEQRSRDDREGSMSPGPRKKKRMRRKSEEMDNHHDASNSSDAHSLPAQNIPSATTQLPANVKLNSDVPEPIETKQEILTRHKEETGSHQTQVPMIKEKLETHTELMLEPKSEYVEEMNEDSIEDLTLDDDDLSNMEQMDDGAGPSHGGEGSSQGFGHWQMGNQSQDEVFLAAQEAVGAHRDSQDSRLREIQYSRRQQYEPNKDFERRPPPTYYYSRPHETQLLGVRRNFTAKTVAHEPRKDQDFGAPSYSKYESNPTYQKSEQEHYQFKTTRFVPNEKATANWKMKNLSAQPDTRLATRKTLSQQSVEKYHSTTFIRPSSNQPAQVKKPQDLDGPSTSKASEPISHESFEERPSPPPPPSPPTPLGNQPPSRSKGYQEFKDPPHSKFVRKPSPQRPVVERPLPVSSKRSTTQGSGLLTDSLSCIFTRRPQKNNQHKIPQKRVFFKEVPQSSETQREKEDPVSDPESTYLQVEKKAKFETPEKQCPEPPVISQATPNISNEDWFATKQRILSSVNNAPAPPPQLQPQPTQENKCPEPPQISVDPHGFDIEPPAHLNKNVSPYVPTNSFERDEYNKYKTQQFKREAVALIWAQNRHKQGFEAAKNKIVQEVKKPPTSYLEDKREKEKADLHKELKSHQQYQRYESKAPSKEEEVPAYEPRSAVQHDSFQEPVTYKPTQLHDTQQHQHQDTTVQQYEHSYNTASYEEQVRHDENEPRGSYKTEFSTYYDEQNSYKQQVSASEEINEAKAPHHYESEPQDNYEDSNDIEQMCPEAPHISENTQTVEDEHLPGVSQQERNMPSYYQKDNYEEYGKFEEQHTFKEPFSAGGSQKMCHKCSFQTTNAKKLKDHLKFVHGETINTVSPTGSQKSGELFSRREPKPEEGQNELFSRRNVPQKESAPASENQNKQFQGRFKRRNTAALVNIISSDVIVPAKMPENVEGEGGGDEKPQETGVLAAMEFFEQTKDQPKKPRPYKRNPDDLLDEDWV